MPLIRPFVSLSVNSDIYAIQLVYGPTTVEELGKTIQPVIFSARDAYVWPSSGIPLSDIRVATYPSFGHWPTKTYPYSICLDTFPPITRVAWQFLIDEAAEAWESATGLVEVHRKVNCSVNEDPMSMILSLRNDANEIFMFNAGLITGIWTYTNTPDEFMNCIRDQTDACTIREFTDAEWANVPSDSIRLADGDVDIVINDMVDSSNNSATGFPVHRPSFVRFNGCEGGSTNYSLYALVVHEVGHAFGLGGIRDDPSSGPYFSHHPVLSPRDSAMAYRDSSPGAHAYQCSPHPFDIMAIYTLYQKVSP